MNVLTTSHGASVTVTELAFYNASGTNLIGSGTAMSSSDYDSDYNAHMAFDGDPTTRWSCEGGIGVLPQWLGYDFGSGESVSVAYMTINETSASGAGDSDYDPLTFDIDYSDDGSTWTTVQSYTAGSWTGVASQTQTFYLPGFSPPSSLIQPCVCCT